MSLVFPSMVRNQILAQHQALRGLISQALVETAGGASEIEHLARRVRELHGRFNEHLAFEEQALVPVLWAVDGWGPERVHDLRGEHARQRQELDAAIEGLEAGWGAQELTRELRCLAAALLKDMDDEEQGCLRASLLCDGCLSYERH